MTLAALSPMETFAVIAIIAVFVLGSAYIWTDIRDQCVEMLDDREPQEAEPQPGSMGTDLVASSAGLFVAVPPSRSSSVSTVGAAVSYWRVRGVPVTDGADTSLGPLALESHGLAHQGHSTRGSLPDNQEGRHGGQDSPYDWNAA